MIKDNIKIVTTCVNYSDYLGITLPYNKEQFQDITVVTSPVDQLTKKICDINHVEYMELEGLGEQDKPFNWSGAYNLFLSSLKNQNSWVIITDADVLFPKALKKFLCNHFIENQDTIYYTSRVYLPMDYQYIYRNIAIAKTSGRFDYLNWSILPAHCWGYFMLFYNDGNKIWNHNDVIFGESFQNMQQLPIEFSIAHIPHGTWADWSKNFYGRKTPKLDELYRNKVTN